MFSITLIIIISVKLLIPDFITAKENILKTDNYETESIQNEKIFSGPMGIGLRKSYETGNNKICIYSTINGQETIKLEDTFINCPLSFPK